MLRNYTKFATADTPPSPPGVKEPLASLEPMERVSVSVCALRDLQYRRRLSITPTDLGAGSLPLVSMSPRPSSGRL